MRSFAYLSHGGLCIALRCLQHKLRDKSGAFLQVIWLLWAPESNSFVTAESFCFLSGFFVTFQLAALRMGRGAARIKRIYADQKEKIIVVAQVLVRGL